jgi:hypothetical protein
MSSSANGLSCPCPTVQPALSESTSPRAVQGSRRLPPTEAQFLVVRRYGFSSWPNLRPMLSRSSRWDNSSTPLTPRISSASRGSPDPGDEPLLRVRGDRTG